MKTIDLDPIEARVQRATPGPWAEGAGQVRGGETRELIIAADGRTIIAMAYGGYGHPTPDCTREDRAFIAHAREDVPALIAEVKRLRALCDDIEAALPACARFVRRGNPEPDLVYSVKYLSEGYLAALDIMEQSPEKVAALIEEVHRAAALRQEPDHG